VSGLPQDGNVYLLADFLAGCFDPTNSENVVGDPKRQVFVDTFSLFGQDSWKIKPNLSVDYGLRYDWEGPVHSQFANLSVFDPSVAGGLRVLNPNQGVWNDFWGGVSPRVGFSYGVLPTTVLRGGFGLYFDSIYMKSVLQNNGAQNISVFGPGLNPAGTEEVAQAPGLSNTVIGPGTPIFETLQEALAGQGLVKISTFDPNFRPSYTESWDLNIQHSFTPSIIGQVGYVATAGRHLMGLFDINPGQLNSLNTPVFFPTASPDSIPHRQASVPVADCPVSASGATPTSPGNYLQCSRPYFSEFPNFSVIDEAKSNLGSIYNSLQASLRIQGWHNLTSQIAYTYGHALDYETGLLPYVPQDPTNEKGEYGNSDFDVRNTFTGYLDYHIPTLKGPERLMKGWEVNSGFSFHGGTPYTVVSSSNPSGNGEGADRAVQVTRFPHEGISHAICGGEVQWFAAATNACGESTPAAFVDAAPGAYSPTRRGQNYNPGYNAVDVALFKTTQITERLSAQFSANVFNIFDHTNLAPVGFPQTGEGGVIGSTLGPYLGNPGIGPGEPVNAEFAIKLIF
jgi:hypothetical protein